MMQLTAGTTVHLLRGSKYAGAWELAEVGPANENGWQRVKTTDRREWFTRPEDAFASEDEARAEGRNRRQPRRKRHTGYGDHAALGMFLGVHRRNQ